MAEMTDDPKTKPREWRIGLVARGGDDWRIEPLNHTTNDESTVPIRVVEYSALDHAQAELKLQDEANEILERRLTEALAEIERLNVRLDEWRELSPLMVDTVPWANMENRRILEEKIWVLETENLGLKKTFLGHLDHLNEGLIKRSAEEE